MNQIVLLDQQTIDKIAAGEVVERPSSVIKELAENSIDAGATAITVEIKEGGITFIRITDNGKGIDKEDIPLAFLRHSTSKIRQVEDLGSIHSLGFRGEALSSIAAVSQMEMITKTAAADTGLKYVIEGGKEKSCTETGAPQGTTILVRNLFYNTPARQKFLKSPMTETGHIQDILIRLALSRSDISFKFITNGAVKLHTSGNGNRKDIIYHIYGRDVAAELVEVSYQNEIGRVEGFAAKPAVSRGNRNYEHYYINGRYIKNSMIAKAIEEAYKPYLMQHRYPFTLLNYTIDGRLVDVNVHPTKMEVRFSNHKAVYELTLAALQDALQEKELIPEATLDEQTPVPQRTEQQQSEAVKSEPVKPEPAKPPAEKNLDYFLSEMKKRVSAAYVPPVQQPAGEALQMKEDPVPYNTVDCREGTLPDKTPAPGKGEPVQQMNLFEEKLLDPAKKASYRIIGQVFGTYWLMEFDEKLYIIDQHAAHEKVLYEQIMAKLKQKEHASQMINPPIVLTLTMQEETLFLKHKSSFEEIGFEIEPFGQNEYLVRGVPANLFSVAKKELLLEMIDGLADYKGVNNPDIVLEKTASMSCKAAVKGNHRLSYAEIETLIQDLMELDNPYHCPHGRPTIIRMSKYELEKKFKRV